MTTTVARLWYEMHTSLVQLWNKQLTSTLATMNTFGNIASGAVDSAFTQPLNTALFYTRTSARQYRIALSALNSLCFLGIPRKRQTVLVAGGTGEIGTQICKKLVDDGHCVITIASPDHMRSAKQWQIDLLVRGYHVDLEECDILSPASCSAMAEVIEKRFRPVDILVNCIDFPVEKSGGVKQTLVDDSLDGIYNITETVVRAMLERGSGRIINVLPLSGNAETPAQYMATKAGIMGFTKTLIRELEDSGINIDILIPERAGDYTDAGWQRDVVSEIGREVVNLADDDTRSTVNGLELAYP